jgi:hypothetical protein
MVMDAAVVVDKIKTMEEEKVGPPGPCSGQSCSRYSMSRTCGPEGQTGLGSFFLLQWLKISLLGDMKQGPTCVLVT